MQVIFLENVAGVAHKGAIKNVKPGYFRNYLLPKGFAVLATPGKLNETKKMREEQIIQRERLQREAEQVRQNLANVTIVLKKKAKEGKLYGSITEKDIIAALKKEAKIGLEKSQIKLPEHLKQVGKYSVPVVLAEGVEANVSVEIEAEA